jgi:hypothetical protein
MGYDISDPNSILDVGIYVLPHDAIEYAVNGIVSGNVKNLYTPEIWGSIGSNISAIEKIKVNLVNGRFTIILDAQDFVKIDSDYYNRISNLFAIKCPDKLLSLRILIDDNIINTPDGTVLIAKANNDYSEIKELIKSPSNNIAKINIADALIGSNEDGRSLVYAIPIPNDTIENPDSKHNRFKVNPDSYYSDFIFSGVDNNHGKNLLDEVADSSKKKKKSSKKPIKKNYKTSRSMKAADSPKKDYNQRGIIISEKDAIKADEKIIKEFLEDFIPGNSEWKKNLRKELTKRWMNSYVLTSKNVKYLDKQYKKYRKNSKSSKKSKKADKINKKIFASTNDFWNDPNK